MASIREVDAPPTLRGQQRGEYRRCCVCGAWRYIHGYRLKDNSACICPTKCRSIWMTGNRELAEKVREGTKLAMGRADVRARCSESALRRASTSEGRAELLRRLALVDRQKAAMLSIQARQNPDFPEKHRAATRLAMRRPDVAARIRGTQFEKGHVPFHKGRRRPEMTGSNHPNWRGGVTPENNRIRNSPEGVAWRKAVFARDNYTCVECGERGGRLNADHIKQFSQYPELRFELSNGRTLCVPCHEKTPTYRRRGR